MFMYAYINLKIISIIKIYTNTMESWNDIETLRNELLTLSGDNHIFSLETLSFIFKQIDSHHLNINERHWIVNFVKQYLNCCQKVQSSERLSQQRMQIAKLIVSLGGKFEQNNNQVHFKHRQAVSILQKLFVQKENQLSININELTYNLKDKQEVLAVSKVVKICCQEDLNSFFFLSSYLIECCNRLVAQNHLVIDIEKQITEVLDFLRKEHPPNDDKPQQDTSIDIGETNKIHHVLFINLSSAAPQDRNQMLQDDILTIARIAKNNLKTLIELTKSICYANNGIGYKVGLKVKDKNSHRSIDRVKEKLLSKNLRKIQIQKEEKSLGQFLKRQRDEYHKTMASMFASTNQRIQFNVSDMLRGKCMFEEISDIKKVAKQIITKIRQKKYNFEIDNRLSGKTTDLVFKIQIEGIIAEFQLAYKFNVVKNEFNHKLYELARSNSFSVLNTLFIFNQSNGQFFNEIYCRIKKLQSESKQIRIKMYEKQEFQPISTLKRMFQQFLKKNNCILQEQVIDEITPQEIQQIRQKITEINKIKKQKKFYKNCEKNYYNGLFLKRCYKFNESIQCFMKEKNNLQEFKIEAMSKVQFDHHLDIQIASSLQMFGKLSEALQWYLKILQYSDSNKKIEILTNVGAVYYHKGNYPLALQYYEKALKVQQDVTGKDSLECSGILMNIGSVHKNQSNLNKALQCYQKSLQIKKKQKGYDSNDITGALNNIGLIYYYQRNYRQALKYYEKCLEIKKKEKGQNNIQCVGVLQNIGIVYSDTNKFDEALKYYTKCLEIKKQAKGQDSIDCANTLNNIGYLYKNQEKFDIAMQYFQKCLSIQRNTKGQQCIDCANTLSNIGSVYLSQNKYSIALNYFQKSHALQMKIKGQCFDCAQVQEKIGICYRDLGKKAQALKHFENSLRVKQKIRGDKSTTCISTLSQMGELYKRQEKDDEAMKLYEKIVELAKSRKIQDNTVANAFLALAQLYLKKSKQQQSLQCYTKALQIQQKMLGSDKNEVLSLRSTIQSMSSMLKSKKPNSQCCK